MSEKCADTSIDTIIELLGEIKETTSGNVEEFNIFKELRIDSKEVIVCRFIKMLLDKPKNLELFFRHVFYTDVPKNPDNVEIVLEDSVKGSDGQNRRADIVIRDEEKTYPIEVKIWAGDQDGQLCDYYKHYFGENKTLKIFYLTPNGHEPSETSRGELAEKQVKCISFSKEIHKWLERIKTSEKNDILKSLINQFMEVISDMAEAEYIYENIKEDSEKIKAAINLIQCKDDIMENIRTDYIKKYFELGDEYRYGSASKNENRYAVLSILKGNKEIALMCVETNLYLRACGKLKKGSKNKWEETDTDNPWIYLSPEGIGKKYDMKNFTNYVENKILSIKDLLNEIED